MAISTLTSAARRRHDQVPPDWYESSVRVNLLQRYWHHRRFQAVGDYSQHLSGPVLDIGSADGFFTAEILRRTQAPRVVGIDILSSSVKYARKRYKSQPRLSFQVADAHALPFRAKSFAAVYCLEALEHVSDPARVLAEIYRVLRPGGYLVLLVPAENLLFKLGWPVWTKFRGKIWKDTHLNFFDGAKLPSLVRRAGFSHVIPHWFILGMLLLVKAVKPASRKNHPKHIS